MVTRSLSAAFLCTAVCAQQPEAARAAPLTRTVTGTVSGQVAEAKEPVRLTLWLHDYTREAAMLVGDVRAAADGAFEFRDVPWLAGFEWGFRFYVLLARQGDRVTALLLRGDDAARAPVAVALAAGVTLRGRVAAATGRAIQGAEVRLQGMIGAETFLFFAETPPQWTTKSRAGGSFAIPGVPAGWKYSVVCVAEKFARGRIDQEQAASFDFELGPGAVLAGRVVLENGKPAPRMRVCAQGTATSAWVTATTDDEGRYRLVGLPEDAFNVWIDAEDLTCVALDSERVVPGEEKQARDLIAIAGGFYVGRVLDAATGKPVQPGATGDVAI
ncbi:MAG TPA: carboxypeptidase-like regulatory domain-containing protein, partial [Planctomycetota bacterium]|nr:carboxypeptidase-like regulatory domain-containing protein [Planctomycetota bacterium]